MANLPDMKTIKNFRLAILALAICSAFFATACDRKAPGQQKNTWNAAKVNWAQYHGKKIARISVNEYGNEIMIFFEDGARVEVASYKYPMHVN